jgi:arginine utilization protein RocB
VAQDWAELGERVMALAERLVAQPSVCRLAGEAEIIDLLEAHLREGLAAQLADGRAELLTVEFQRRQIGGGSLGGPGKALLAWIAPSKETSRALALLGHCDTVSLATYPAHDLGPDWRHGPGWLDMKGGVAAITELFVAHAQANTGRGSAVEPIPAHILLLLTTDEEDSSLGAYTLLPVLKELLKRRNLELDCVVNADFCEPEAKDKLQGTVYCGSAGKLLLGINVAGLPAHACAAGEGVNAGSLAAYIAAGLEDLPSLAVQSGPQRLPPPRVLMQEWARDVYDVTTVASGVMFVNLLHDGSGLPSLWKHCLRTVRELAHEYQVQQRRRMLAWAQRTKAETLGPAPPAALVTDYAALVKTAAAMGIEAAGRGTGERSEPRRALHMHIDRLVRKLRKTAGRASGIPLAREICSGRPLIVLSLLPPFYPGGGMPPGDAQRAALGRAARAHGADLLPLYPYISDLSAFCWTPANLALAEQGPLFPHANETARWSSLAVPVCNIGPIGYGAHTADERVYVPYLRDTLPRLLDSALRELAAMQ